MRERPADCSVRPPFFGKLEDPVKPAATRPILRRTGRPQHVPLRNRFQRVGDAGVNLVPEVPGRGAMLFDHYRSAGEARGGILFADS